MVYLILLPGASLVEKTTCLPLGWLLTTCIAAWNSTCGSICNLVGADTAADMLAEDVKHAFAQGGGRR
jgi:hypothetical protein